MPNYYAHLDFGRRVAERLPALLRSAITREEESFLAGCLGPDPLFFYRPLFPSPPRQAGIDLHHHSFRAPAERLLAAVEARAPFAVSYSAGFLCHFALDSACHPLVAEQTARGLAHSAVENELGRALMTARGLDPLRDTPIPSFDLPEGFFAAAAVPDPRVTAGDFREALASFRRVCLLQTRGAGTWAAAAMDRLGGRLPQLSILRGSVLPARPDPSCAPAVEALLHALEEAVLPTAGAITEFFSAATARQGGLDGWYDRDFYGQSVPSPAAVS